MRRSRKSSEQRSSACLRRVVVPRLYPWSSASPGNGKLSAQNSRGSSGRNSFVWSFHSSDLTLAAQSLNSRFSRDEQCQAGNRQQTTPLRPPFPSRSTKSEISGVPAPDVALVDGIHDLGGMAGFGPVIVETHQPVFHHVSESRAWGVAAALS